jgi:O-acetyl-ADP-ribose deacetylase (regulator of RNase III)
VRCPTGEARITPAFDLPVRYIIHTVGPIWHGGRQGEEKLLASCYHESLRLAFEHGVRSIAFPSISCGIFGYPLESAARIAMTQAREWAAAFPARIVFCCFGSDAAKVYRRLLIT